MNADLYCTTKINASLQSRRMNNITYVHPRRGAVAREDAILCTRRNHQQVGLRPPYRKQSPTRHLVLVPLEHALKQTCRGGKPQADRQQGEPLIVIKTCGMWHAQRTAPCEGNQTHPRTLEQTHHTLTMQQTHLRLMTIVRAPETCAGASTGRSGHTTVVMMSSTPERGTENEESSFYRPN